MAILLAWVRRVCSICSPAHVPLVLPGDPQVIFLLWLWFKVAAGCCCVVRVTADPIQRCRLLLLLLPLLSWLLLLLRQPQLVVRLACRRHPAAGVPRRHALRQKVPQQRGGNLQTQPPAIVMYAKHSIVQPWQRKCEHITVEHVALVRTPGTSGGESSMTRRTQPSGRPPPSS